MFIKLFTSGLKKSFCVLAESFRFYKVFLLVLVFSLCFVSCNSAKFFTEPEFIPEPGEYVNPNYDEEQNFSFDEDKTFIFLRFLTVNYKRRFSKENLLRYLQNFTEIEKFPLNHASINFDLNDEFYGVTIYGDKDLKKESCMHSELHPYLGKCWAEKCIEKTYALEVSKEEYEAAKKMVEEYYDEGQIHFDFKQDFLNIPFCTKRKFFMDPEHRTVEDIDWPVSEPFEGDKPHKFVCSSFIAYVLYTNVKSIHDYFDKFGINYNYIYISDLPYLPGMTKLFESKWKDYDDALDEFIMEHPEYVPYCLERW